MTPADLVPLVGTVGAVCGGLGGAIGAWLKGRAQAATAKVVAEAREAVAAHDADRTISPALLERIRVLEARCDACDERDTANRVLLTQAGHDLDEVREALRETKAEADGLRNELRATKRELARLREESYAQPAGAD